MAMGAVVVITDVFRVCANNTAIIKNRRMKVNAAARTAGVCSVLTLGCIYWNTIFVTLRYLIIIIEFVQSKNSIRW